MICLYCKTNPGAKPNGLWKGFRDADTNELVCWRCRRAHYRRKFSLHPEFKGTYSEFPVMALAPQLMLKLNF